LKTSGIIHSTDLWLLYLNKDWISMKSSTIDDLDSENDELQIWESNQ
jgi:hypothetical protein